MYVTFSKSILAISSVIVFIVDNKVESTMLTTFDFCKVYCNDVISLNDGNSYITSLSWIAVISKAVVISSKILNVLSNTTLVSLIVTPLLIGSKYVLLILSVTGW